MVHYYAQLNNEDICCAVSQLGAPIDAPNMIAIEAYEVTLLGRHYDKVADEWGEAPPPPRHISGLAFISRFTDAEAIAIDLASIGATPQAAAMRRYLNKVNRAEYIDLDREDTRGGVLALEAAGLLSAGRALQILDGAIQDIEIYRR